MNKLFLFLTILISAVIHEYSHAALAKHFGDDTAEKEGRLTINPLKHIDLFGTIIFPLFLLFFANIFIGWAKPVPINPYNFRRKNATLWVALAGPASNFLVAILIGLFLRFSILAPSVLPITFAIGLAFIVNVNLYLGLFNLIPIPPLDGSKVFEEIFYRKFSPKGIFIFSTFGTLIALFIAFWILPPLTSFVFRLIVGRALLGA